ncbi:tail fiber domain-containing protein [Streptomyces sp. NBC_01267]|uniref:tail fiber domain-containing protein n=1 Tax=unclassified Streptomyces TaxID=2593676 RepID=UPI002254488E|nr:MULTISPECIES: tail fiber domain-containing protein [unclassified Streptomyces]MCX4548045.1 tail fiber domain-containing protein [Streptomyces sp. NBC_01500]
MRILHRRSRAADRGTPDRRAAGAPEADARETDARENGAREAGAVAPVGAVNGYAVLETVATLPLSTWRYLWEPEDVRHLGPMAQDWQAAFGFNQDGTTIPVVDGLGVALVCVQALNRRVEELTAEVDRLREATRANRPEAA